MPALQVDSLHFTFAADLAAEWYDKWQHYIAVWNVNGGRKAVDVVAVETAAAPAITWLIEAKDFRIITYPPKPSNIGGLAATVTAKVADTMTGLADAAASAAVATEKNHAAISMASPSQRVILHLEPHTGAHSALFPLGFAANVLQKLKQLVKAIDPNPMVLNIANTPAAGVPWTVA